MQRITILSLIVLLSATNGLFAQSKNPVVIMDTNYGIIKIELNAEKAPISVANFLKYVESKFYDGTIFHRVIDNFMIQGGGHTADLKEKKTRTPIKNEAGNGLSNKRGTIVMARTVDPNSATAQFFINVKDNRFLDRSAKSAGYAVFGKVVSGMDVVDKIRKVRTRSARNLNDVPMDPVIIKSVRQWENVVLKLKGSFAPNKLFTIMAYVSHPERGQSLQLQLPDGVRLVEGPALQAVPAAAAHGSSLVIWKASAVRYGKFELIVRSGTGVLRKHTITVAPRKR